MEPERVTLNTVARHVGVSRSTVSNAYNHPDQLSADLREQILAAADALGYAGPDPAARSLRRRRAGAIGLAQGTLVYSVTDPANQLLLAGIAEELEGRGLALVLIPAREPALQQDVLATTMLDGLIAHGDALVDTRRKVLRDRRLPVVVLDGEPAEDERLVAIDEEAGAEAAARHLVGLGHRRLAVVSFPTWGRPPKAMCGQRAEGYQRAVAAIGGGVLPIHEAPSLGHAELGVAIESTTRAAARVVALELLASPDRPTGILAMSDELAAGVLDAAHELGIAVPESLSVVGFDDAATAVSVTPQLTTVRQDLREKGRTAVRLLLDEQTARRVVLPTTLVVRGSTGPPPR